MTPTAAQIKGVNFQRQKGYGIYSWYQVQILVCLIPTSVFMSHLLTYITPKAPQPFTQTSVPETHRPCSPMIAHCPASCCQCYKNRLGTNYDLLADHMQLGMVTAEQLHMPLYYIKALL